MSKVIDLNSRRECQHVWEDGEIPGGGAVKVCTKCGLGYATDDGDTILEKAISRFSVLEEQNDALRTEYGKLRETFIGLVLNIRDHRQGKCPGLVAADCLEAIYEATEIAAAVEPTLSEKKP